MAKATARVVEKVVKEIEGVTLELSASEADWLRDYVGRSNNVDYAVSIYRALEAPAESDDQPIQVGDKVRITSVNDSSYLHKVGKLEEIDKTDPDLIFLVDLGNSDWTWAKSVERVSD